MHTVVVDGGSISLVFAFRYTSDGTQLCEFELQVLPDDYVIARFMDHFSFYGHFPVHAFARPVTVSRFSSLHRWSSSRQQVVGHAADIDGP